MTATETTTTIESFKHHIHVGHMANTGTQTHPRVFVTVDWNGKRLSFTGVEGPTRGGDCKGSCGQIVMHWRDDPSCWTYDAKGMPRERVERLMELWSRWHLNDMKAGCVHQRNEGWADRPIDPTKPTNTYGTHFEGQTSPSWNMLAWVRPDEHPGGLLTKPCPQCGYRYGTAWLYEDVPDHVVAELRAFPTHDGLPVAWR